MAVAGAGNADAPSVHPAKACGTWQVAACDDPRKGMHADEVFPLLLRRPRLRGKCLGGLGPLLVLTGAPGHDGAGTWFFFADWFWVPYT